MPITSASDERLSPNFRLSEFTVSQEGARRGLRNEPLSSQVANLRRVANLLEQVRTLLGSHRIIITSGFRSPAINSLVGGSDKSAHMQGLAADFICPDFGTPRAICLAILDSPLPFDQLIHEGRWVHIALGTNTGESARRDVRTAIFEAGRGPIYAKGII